MHAPADAPRHALVDRTCALALLPTGATARLSGTRLDADTRELLRGLGLTDASTVQVCKPGDPFIIQVRRTRLGLSRAVAEAILVVRDDRPADSGDQV